MNLDRLRTGLAELAEEAQPADLRDRAVGTARRIARTRLALIAGATVVIVAAASSAAALARDDRALPEVATTPTPSATLPSGAVSAVYVDGLDGLDGQGTITVWDGLGVRRHPAADNGIGRHRGVAVQQSLTVSPDGAHLSWTTAAGVHLARVGGNDMWTLDPQGQNLRMDTDCFAPEWAPGSDRLLVRGRDEGGSPRVGWYFVADGSFADADVLWSGCDVHLNGDWAAYTERSAPGQSTSYVRNLRTGETHQIPDISERLDLEIVSVSPDGARVTARAFNHNDSPLLTPMSRTLAANHVIDTATGESLRIDTGDLDPRQFFFTPGGELVARVGDEQRSRLLLIAPDGRLLAAAEEPEEVREAVLLRLVVP